MKIRIPEDESATPWQVTCRWYVQIVDAVKAASHAITTKGEMRPRKVE
jgi:hypothetical protein